MYIYNNAITSLMPSGYDYDQAVKDTGEIDKIEKCS